MSFPRYPKYKDSGVEWLGEVPEHWDFKRFKSVVRERDERSHSGDETLLSVSAYTGVTPRSEVIDESDHLTRASTLEGYKICRVGDLAMNIMLAWNRGLGFSTYDGIVSPAYCVFSVIDGSDPRFLDYLVRSDEYIRYFKAFSSGVVDSRLRLYPNVFVSLSCALPGLAEQRTIADFLDCETNKINALIEAQSQLIGLLQEKRYVAISTAVVQGLTSSAVTRCSGFDLPNKIPAHWEAKRMRYVATEVTVGIVVEPSKYYVDSGVPALRSLNVRAGSIVLDDLVFISEEANSLLAKSQLHAGDLVAVRSGQPGTTAVVPAELEGCNCIDLIIIRAPEQVSSQFLCWYLASDAAIAQFSAGSDGAIQQHFNVGSALDLIVPVPPREEQAAIAAYLDRTTQELDALIAEAEHAIALLREHYSALISAAVTGKIDVRNYASDQAEAA